MCASATEADMPTHTDIFRGGSDVDGAPTARGSGTVPTLRAMSCQLDNMNRLPRDAEYDNAEFYRTAIKRLQQNIDDFERNARAAAAAAAVRSSKNGTIFTGETIAELKASASSWLEKGDPTRSLRGVDPHH